MKIKVMKEELVRFDVTKHTQGAFDVLAYSEKQSRKPIVSKLRDTV